MHQTFLSIRYNITYRTINSWVVWLSPNCVRLVTACVWCPLIQIKPPPWNGVHNNTVHTSSSTFSMTGLSNCTIVSEKNRISRREPEIRALPKYVAPPLVLNVLLCLRFPGPSPTWLSRCYHFGCVVALLFFRCMGIVRTRWCVCCTILLLRVSSGGHVFRGDDETYKNGSLCGTWHEPKIPDFGIPNGSILSIWPNFSFDPIRNFEFCEFRLFSYFSRKFQISRFPNFIIYSKQLVAAYSLPKLDRLALYGLVLVVYRRSIDGHSVLALSGLLRAYMLNALHHRHYHLHFVC